MVVFTHSGFIGVAGIMRRKLGCLLGPLHAHVLSGEAKVPYSSAKDGLGGPRTLTGKTDGKGQDKLSARRTNSPELQPAPLR